MADRNNRVGIHTDPTASSGAGSTVTPSDSVALDMTRALYVGGTGNMSVLLWDDTGTVLFAAVPAGSLLSIRVRKVMATNTTATNIVALY